MINESRVKMVTAADLVYYVECTGHDNEGKPVYKTQGAWYLGSYAVQRTADHLMHIVTMGDFLDTTVVRHVPSSRLFPTLPDAYLFVKRLYEGRAEYER